MNKYISGFKINYDILLINKFIKNVYILLSLVFLFTAFVAWFSVITFVKNINPYISFVLFVVLYYLVVFTKNSMFGIFFLFYFLVFWAIH